MNRKIRRKEERKLARRVVAREGDEPRWDHDLPRTIEAIEKAMLVVSEELLSTPSPGSQQLPDGRVKVFLSPPAAKLLKLQLQLFRCVFGREPGPDDPVFWDRTREHKGAFRMDRVAMLEAEAKVEDDPVKARIAQIMLDLDKA